MHTGSRTREQPTPARQQGDKGLHPSSHKELNSANHLNEQENRLSPERRAVLPVPQFSQGNPFDFRPTEL